MALPARLLSDPRAPSTSASLRSLLSTRHSPIEIHLGRLIEILSDSRLALSSSQAVLFSSLPPECRFEPGIDRRAYDRLAEWAKKKDSSQSKDTLSISGFVRKKSMQGRQPVYEKKYKAPICFIHAPTFGYDMAVYSIERRPVENPDRRPGAYDLPRSRTKTVVRRGQAEYVIEESIHMGQMAISEVTSKRKSRMDVDYGMRIRLPGGGFEKLTELLLEVMGL